NGKRQCVRQISWHVPDVTPTPHQKRPRPINNQFGRGHSYCLRMRRHWWRVHWTSHEFLAPMSIHGHFELNMPRLTVVPTFQLNRTACAVKRERDTRVVLRKT